MRKPIKADTRIPLCRILGSSFIALLTLFLLSCYGQKRALEQDQEKSNTDPILTLLLQDDYSGLDIEETSIITNTKTLQAFFVNVNRTRKPGLPLPEVDFSKETVLIYCSGEINQHVRPKLSIADVTDHSIIITPTLEEKQKKGASLVITSPFSIYKIPSTQKKIIFQKNR
ncbi:hypothetical protein [Ulvibacterium sp.]|uniref:hypothetical protein n=1 Tax=Ulvibacterium sp. TaxID=2665914 RepID=UPI00261CDF5C|nr:hypothetical protein [Ulvibacterium sp.]